MTTFAIPADHASLPGHFPGRPLVPGVVLLERVIDAVVSDCAAMGIERPQGSWRLPQAKFLQPLLPGEIARIELERVGTGNSGGTDMVSAELRWRFRVLRDASVLATGEISCPVASAADAQTEHKP